MLDTAKSVRLQQSPLVRAIFRARELVLGAQPAKRSLDGLLEETLALGWGVLAEVPDKEVVVGAVTQPWQANVVFRAVPPGEFRAFAARDGRATQVFINLVDNRATHDKEPFVPFGRIVQGMDVVDALYQGYGESALGGIRAGKQDPLFAQGNRYLKEHFPRLDYITTARVEAR